MVGTGTIWSTEGARHFDLARPGPEERLTGPIPHQALYRRWRAQTFREIVGQEAVVETLRNGVRTGRVSHAVLFVGPRGTGKTSLARILAKALNCTDLQDGDACDACPSCVAIREGTTLDLVEIDAASNNGIESIRNLRERLPYPPGELRRKVYILDEAHQITGPAWNALLKSLEEPPEFVNFMFASTEPSRFPAAILSRLQRYDVRRLTIPEIEGKLARILEADGRTADPEAIHLIARLAAGGMRDAESMLDQLLSAAPDAIDERRVRDLLGLAEAEAVTAFVDALVRGDAATGIALLDSLEERGRDARTLLDQTIDEIRADLVRALSSGDGADTAGLADAARRLAAIDPDRAGIGGLRLQLELALFASAGAAPGTGADRVVQAVAPTRITPAAQPPAIEPAEPVATKPSRVTSTASEPPTAPSTAASGSDAIEDVAPEPAAIDAPATPVPAAIDAAPEPPAKTEAPATRPKPDAPTVPEQRPATAPDAPAVPLAKTSAPADQPAAAASVDGDLARVQAGWPEIVASVGPATRAVIKECRPMAVDGNVVTLGFPETRAFLKDQAERKRPELETAFGTFLGRTVAVRTVATNIEIPPPMAPDELLTEAGRIFADVRVDVAEID
jgi:DNA polymerase III subunit gamma/tau